MSEGAGWLQISTEGFAALNQSRPPEHLVKELVQNSLDAVEGTGGSIDLSYRHDGNSFVVECRDTGEGIPDLTAMRVVYLTFKTDSHLKRGRFGRGFKEILSVATSATIESAGRRLCFFEENGRQVTQEGESQACDAGTFISMSFDWPLELVEQFDDYFDRLLVPGNVQLSLNGRSLPSQLPAHAMEATLKTEVYNPQSHSWRKPQRKTTIELFPVVEGEEAFIYEMGIPVASTEWSVPYHANVLQRVPMNPNRDALASGYAKQIHRECLPTLLPELSAEETTADWVGAAGAETAPEIQKQIIAKAFGKNAVRSVPSTGKRDYDDDAERNGAFVVKTAHMSSGFRDMARAHLSTTKFVVQRAESKAAESILDLGFNSRDVGQKDDPRFSWIEKQGGHAHVDHCLSFAVWFCQQLVDSTEEELQSVTGNLAIGSQPVLLSGGRFGKFLAHWSETNVLTLAIDVDCFWTEPFGAETLRILIHEAGHARNMHHGKSFVEEVERLGGVAASVMFEQRDEIARRWPALFGHRTSARKVAETKPKRSWFLDLRRRT
ncbi:MAG: ATP-binding protein [Pseudomonadota bacterium]